MHQALCVWNACICRLTWPRHPPYSTSSFQIIRSHHVPVDTCQAAVIVFLASAGAGFITGINILVDGGMSLMQDGVPTFGLSAATVLPQHVIG